jgi:hypothetical protein
VRWVQLGGEQATSNPWLNDGIRALLQAIIGQGGGGGADDALGRRRMVEGRAHR